MPHLTLEYSRNLTDFDADAALVAINQAMADSGLFGEPDIKSRAIGFDHFRIGTADLPRAFIHVRIAMLSGRSPEDRKRLADGVLAALTAAVHGQKTAKTGMELQLSVETTDLDRPSYAKAVLNG